MSGSFLFTVDVEEWFDTRWFGLENLGYSRENPPRTNVVEGVRVVADLLRSHGLAGTFFVLAKTCIRYPEILEIIREERRNEIALHGFTHRGIQELGQADFKKDIAKAVRVVRDMTGVEVTGYRAPNLLSSQDAIDVLIDLGFAYDSSFNPCLPIPGWYGDLRMPTKPFWLRGGQIHSKIAEVPHSVLPVLRLPGNGGWFLRNVGKRYVTQLLRLAAISEGYAMLYIHPWEVLQERPKSGNIPFHVFRRCGPDTTESLESIVKALGTSLRFRTVGEYLRTLGMNR